MGGKSDEKYRVAKPIVYETKNHSKLKKDEFIENIK